MYGDTISIIVDSIHITQMQLVKFFTNQKGITDFEVSKMRQKIRELEGQVAQFENDQSEKTLYKQNLKKNQDRVNNMISEYHEMKGVLDIDTEPLPDNKHNFSNSDNHLIKTLDDLEVAGGLKRIKIDKELQALTLEDIEELICNSTSMTQKMTALKVLKRHFKNPMTQEQETNVNFYDTYAQERQLMEQDIKDLNHQIEKLKAEKIKNDKKSQTLMVSVNMYKNQSVTLQDEVKSTLKVLQAQEKKTGKLKNEVYNVNRKVEEVQQEAA